LFAAVQTRAGAPFSSTQTPTHTGPSYGMADGSLSNSPPGKRGFQTQAPIQEQLECYRLALGAHRPVLVPSGMYQGTFAKSNRARGLPAPPSPVDPPVLGSLVRSAQETSNTPRTTNTNTQHPAIAIVRLSAISYNPI
jgi:hypothetical protein